MLHASNSSVMKEKRVNTNRWIRFSHGVTGVINLMLLSPAVPYAAAQTGDQSPPFLYPSLGKNIKPSMTVVLVALVAAFFLLGFFSVYIRQCAERHINRGATQTTAVGNGQRSRRAARGLDASVIESFPTFLYSSVKGLKIGKGALECAVCLNEFEENETLRLLPKCNHVFHSDCIDVWLSSHTTCPVCRANLIPKTGENAFATVPVCDPAEDPIRDLDDSNTDLEIQAPPIQNQDRPSRSRSIKDRIIGIFPRSHSTGHSLCQENFDRFTLTLPEDVRSQLMNSNLSRTKSCVAFPRVSSSRSGFRSGSGRTNLPYYERFDRVSKLDGWAFSLTPPFLIRTGSTRQVDDGEAGKSTGRNVYRPGQYEGERSTDRLRVEDGPSVG